MSSLKTLSLFTGAGGLDLGLHAAGFINYAAIEVDDCAVRTLHANQKCWGHIVHENIHRLLTPDHGRGITDPDFTGFVGPERVQIDLLAGGPPCQPFSKSGYWSSGDSKRLDDPRAQTLNAYLKVLERVRPKVFLLENVPGIAFSEKSEGLAFIRSRVSAINTKLKTNYRLSVGKLNAAYFGVPQLRERVFVIGHRNGALFNFPKPTHGLPPRVKMGAEKNPSALCYEPADGLQRALTAWDAIGHLPAPTEDDLEPRGKWAPVLPTIPEGANYLWHTERGGGIPLWGWRTRYWSMLLKLAKNRPAWTLTSQPGPATGPFHWKNRRLSAAELSALQTFPAHYKIMGNSRDVHRQLGNAVPSALAECLGIEIRRQFFGCQKVGQLSLLPARAASIPEPEPVQNPNTLPPSILRLAGVHAPHPGPGLGPGAIDRTRNS